MPNTIDLTIKKNLLQQMKEAQVNKSKMKVFDLKMIKFDQIKESERYTKSNHDSERLYFEAERVYIGIANS